VFYYLTYEGAIDLDRITDTFQRQVAQADEGSQAEYRADRLNVELDHINDAFPAPRLGRGRPDRQTDGLNPGG
jgi:hypothetical protein